MDTEIWKDIPGYEGLYQVSDMGNVRSLDRRSKSYLTRMMTLKGKVMKQCLERKIGYFTLRLFKNGADTKFFVHRLVAMTFIPNPESKEQVDHINGTRDDNRLENLRWATHGENQHYKHVLGYKNNFQLNPPNLGKFGKDNKDSKRVGQYDDEGDLIAEYDSLMDIKREFKCSIGNISSVCNGKRPKAYGFIWKYL